METRRRQVLDMGYEYMTSLIEDLSTEELQAESEKLKNEISVNNKKQSELIEEKEKKSRKLGTLNRIIERRDRNKLSTTEPTSDHFKILKRMYFEEIKNGGDLVFIGCDGKRPLGNSNLYGDIAEALEWELPNDDLSEDQRARAEKLLRELPFVINNIFKKLI